MSLSRIAAIVGRDSFALQQELEEAKAFVEKTRPKDDVEEEEWDVSMVAEYSDEIFEYMRELEVSIPQRCLPCEISRLTSRCS